MNDKLKFTDEQHNAIVAAARRALDKVKHHEKFGTGARFAKAFKHELSGAFDVDKLVVFVTKDKIQVWGCGVHMDQTNFGLFSGLGWEWRGNTERESWQALILREIDRNDTADYQERRRQEREPMVALALRVMNSEAEILLAQLGNLRKQAASLVGNLPVPAAATLRKNNPCWSNPSTELTEQFPNLFKS